MTAQEKLEICKACPLYKDTVYGAICNPSLYMNDKGEISYVPKAGFKAGCNCRLAGKTANPGSHCSHKK